MDKKQIYAQDRERGPLVSFIITYHNEPIDMLRECLQSILNLSLSAAEREIVLVDDASDSSPIASLDAYADDIIYVRQPHGGVSVARNRGLSVCLGTFVQFVDADDCLLRASYEHCLDLVRYNDADVVAFRHTHQMGDETPFTYEGPTDGATYMRHNNIQGRVCNYIFKRSILINLRFTKGVAFGEDEEFTPQLLLRSERLYVSEAKPYYYRLRPGSAIQSKDKRSKVRRLTDTFGVICRLNTLADTLPQTEKEALTRRVNQLTMDYIYNSMVLTHDWRYVERLIDRLHGAGLFPLPDADYTKKYKLFRRITATKSGRRLLLRLLTMKRS